MQSFISSAHIVTMSLSSIALQSLLADLPTLVYYIFNKEEGPQSHNITFCNSIIYKYQEG